MATQSLSELIRHMELLANGMQNHLSQLSVIGLGQGDVDNCKGSATRLAKLDNEQETLKAALAAKTAEMRKEQADARKISSRATKRIKAGLEDQPELWKEFGITAKK